MSFRALHSIRMHGKQTGGCTRLRLTVGVLFLVGQT